MQADPRGHTINYRTDPAHDIIKGTLKQSELCAAYFRLKQKPDPESTQMLLICIDFASYPANSTRPALVIFPLLQSLFELCQQ